MSLADDLVADLADLYEWNVTPGGQLLLVGALRGHTRAEVSTLAADLARANGGRLTLSQLANHIRVAERLAPTDEEGRPILPGQLRLVDHPQVHRRANPVEATTVGPDPDDPDGDRWVMSGSYDLPHRLFSAVPGDLVEPIEPTEAPCGEEPSS